MKELDVVRLKESFGGLPAGTEGTVVLEYDGSCFEVEFFDAAGNTVGVLTTPADMLEAVPDVEAAETKEAFLAAPMFGGKTFWEAEQDIEWVDE